MTSVGLSPSVTLDVTGAQGWADPVTGYWKPGGKAIDTATAYRAAFPIELTSPDVFRRPDKLGDGGNQFVYGGEQPDGYLSIPGSMTVTGGSQDDAQWLVDNNKIDMKVENSTIGGAFTHGWAVAGSRILLDTSYTDENGMQAYSYGWVFKGLPTLNSGFGNHEVNLYVDGSKSQTAHIQTFFAAMAQNYPLFSFTNSGRNWYYYYGQVYPANETGIDFEDTNDPSHTETIPPYVTHITNDAYGTYQAHVYRISEATDYIEDCGYLHINGIHNYIFTRAHEATHKQYLTDGIDNAYRPRTVNPNINPDDPNADPATDPDGDWDQDGLSNGWEIAHHLNPRDPDTADDFAGQAPGDTELYANIGGLGVLKPLKNTWKQDWANTGLQWGAWFPHNTDQNPSATEPYHPWWYEAEFPGLGNIGNFPDPTADVLTSMP